MKEWKNSQLEKLEKQDREKSIFKQSPNWKLNQFE